MRRNRWSPIRFGNPHKRKAAREEKKRQEAEKAEAEPAPDKPK